jgi:16S rRNA (cytosine967-C5)-methyltransferase
MAEPPAPADTTEALGLRWSFPTWIVARWLRRLGPAETVELMRALNERPPLTVRTNTLRITREALAERLRREESADVRLAVYAPEGLHVGHGGTPASWGVFAEGLLVAQDEASMLVARLLAPRAGETAADACAAPGTKTTHLAELMSDRGRLLAFDPQPTRLSRVREAAVRLGLHIVETLDGPVEALAPGFLGACDAVLVDAPCSNLGVLRRHPDVKWRRGPDELVQHAARQTRILAAAATMVKRGGALVYATCSLEPEENDDVVSDQLAREPGLLLADPRPLLPEPARALVGEDRVLRTQPADPEVDGFTAFVLERVAP